MRSSSHSHPIAIKGEMLPALRYFMPTKVPATTEKRQCPQTCFIYLLGRSAGVALPALISNVEVKKYGFIRLRWLHPMGDNFLT